MLYVALLRYQPCNADWGLMRHERPRAPVLGGQSALVIKALTRSPERLDSAAGGHRVDRRPGASVGHAGCGRLPSPMPAPSTQPEPLG